MTPEVPFAAFSNSGGNWWMMADLLGEDTESLVFAHQLVCLTKNGVELFGQTVISRGIARHREASNVNHAQQWISSTSGLVQKVAVLEVLDKALQQR